MDDAESMTSSRARAAEQVDGPWPGALAVVHPGADVSGHKAWARAHLKGVETFVLPSFTPDFAGLDEEGVRADVRHAADQGFRSVLVSSVGASGPEAARMEEIVADEARGRLFPVTSIQTAASEAQPARLKRAEGLGFTHAIMLNDNRLASEHEIYQRMAAVIGQTSLAVVLYAAPHPNIVKLDPTGIALDAFDRLADLPNVVAVKFTQELAPAAAFEVARRLGDRLIIGPVQLGLVPLLASQYPMQWTGQWAVDALQSPAQPHVVEFMRLMSLRRIDEAMTVYWKLHPAARSFYDLQATSLRIGGHPWNHIKYYQWLTGGNGGVLRDLKLSAEAMPPLDAAGRQYCRAALESVGVTVTDLPDEAFILGVAAYTRGARLENGAAIPQYSF